nr:coat protein [Raphanus sativus cryptic virus 1]
MAHRTPTNAPALPQVDGIDPNLPPNDPGTVAAAPNARNLHLEREQEARQDRAATAFVPNTRFTVRRPTIRPPPAHSAPDLETALFDSAVNHPPTTVSYPSTSSYIPNFTSAFYYLNKMDSLMVQTLNWTNNCSGWVPPYSQIYISMLLYLQVMRAMKKAGVLRPNSELSHLFNEMSTIFPFESLMVPGPLVNLFENITAFRPLQTDSFGNVTPFLPAEPGWSNATFFAPNGSLVRHLPHIPALISRLRRICETASENGLNDISFSAHHHGPEFISELFGHICDNDLPEQLLLLTPGLATSYSGTLYLWRQARSQLQRSLFPEALTVNDVVPNTWTSFLCLDNDDSWFSPLAAMMNKYCQYWHGSAPLSSIPADGSAAGSMICNELNGSSIYRLAQWTAPIMDPPADEDAPPVIAEPGYYYLNPNPVLIFDARTCIEDISSAHMFSAMTFHPNLIPYGADRANFLKGQFWNCHPPSYSAPAHQVYPAVSALIAREYHSETNLSSDK